MTSRVYSRSHPKRTEEKFKLSFHFYPIYVPISVEFKEATEEKFEMLEYCCYIK